jgi:crotonobetainyl-CoA:carnitine CoA-transferase CaiB-like acyl-CoA transferase
LSVPYQAFQAQDDWVVVAAFTPRMWEGVCRAIERPQWAADERFANSSKRAANRATLIPMLAEVFATRTVEDWVTRLSAEGVPCTSVNSIDKVVTDPQVAARDMIVEVDHPTIGRYRMAGLPIKLSANPGSVKSPPPLLGEHSRQVLAGLGLTQDRIDALVTSGVIGVPA